MLIQFNILHSLLFYTLYDVLPDILINPTHSMIRGLKYRVIQGVMPSAELEEAIPDQNPCIMQRPLSPAPGIIKYTSLVCSVPKYYTLISI